jgi:uncharacterized protein (DUF2225 family)
MTSIKYVQVIISAKEHFLVLPDKGSSVLYWNEVLKYQLNLRDNCTVGPYDIP